MRIERLWLRRLVWIVSFTILAGALLPLLSHLTLARDAAVWTEVCTVTGARFVRLDVERTSPAPASDPDDRGMTSMMERCPYCAIHASVPALPPAPLVWHLHDSLAFERPRLFFLAPRPLYAWASALARAPPAAA